MVGAVAFSGRAGFAGLTLAVGPVLVGPELVGPVLVDPVLDAGSLAAAGLPLEAAPATGLAGFFGRAIGLVSLFSCACAPVARRQGRSRLIPTHASLPAEVHGAGATELGTQACCGSGLSREVPTPHAMNGSAVLCALVTVDRCLDRCSSARKCCISCNRRRMFVVCIQLRHDNRTVTQSSRHLKPFRNAIWAR